MNITRQLTELDWFESNQILKFCQKQDKFVWEARIVDFHLPKGQNEFRRLVFHGVINFERFIPEHQTGNKFKDTERYFFLKDFEGSYESESSKVYKDGAISHIEIIMPYLLGVISFSFLRCELINRVSIGEETIDGNFVYEDIISGEVFDFFEPFNVKVN